MLLDGQLTLVSPYDPNAGFNVGHAMQRNKLIYALADASLVVSSDINRGGTWAGAVEQLDKFRFVPIYVRSLGEPSRGLDALLEKGALAWPNPDDVQSFEEVFGATIPTSPDPDQRGLPLLTGVVHGNGSHKVAELPEPYALPSAENRQPGARLVDPDKHSNAETPEDANPAETLFFAVREAIKPLLNRAMKNSEVAAALNVTNSQARAWLERLMAEGVVEMQKKPKAYILRGKKLF
jgi:predicted Rossmann fold nucleotide-binding protein DprA/Smf involved in DNA uptake